MPNVITRDNVDGDDNKNDSDDNHNEGDEGNIGDTNEKRFTQSVNDTSNVCSDGKQ